jgi:bacillithiol synthase
VLVTTGQQPGLFGGPLLTWLKALSAIALADELEALTGVPTAPLFWAATDDADFEEARGTRVALPGGARRLESHVAPPAGTPMAATPLGEMRQELELLLAASGSATDREPLEAVFDAYRPDATVGDAYVTLLRRLLHPLGASVLDASHPCVLDAARPLLRRALERADVLSSAVAARTREIEAAGMTPQVQEVPGLSLVFAYEGAGKRRLAVREAAVAPDTRLGPTVLLRPVLERALLPTAAYCAGPGEIAYFAQVSAVAAALEVPVPLVVPRWSATVIEPQVQRTLERLGVTRQELQRAHEVEGRLARAALPAPVAADLAALREDVERRLAALEIDDTEGLVPSAAVQGTRRALLHRLERLERRFVASTKRREVALMNDVATVRGALHPDGKRQERALNFVPLLARQGRPLVAAMQAEARRHARGLLGVDAASAMAHGTSTAAR